MDHEVGAHELGVPVLRPARNHAEIPSEGLMAGKAHVRRRDRESPLRETIGVENEEPRAPSPRQVDEGLHHKPAVPGVWVFNQRDRKSVVFEPREFRFEPPRPPLPPGRGQGRLQ